jgi:hypothetical protein
MTFYEIYQNLTDKEDKRELRNKVVSVCEIQPSTWYSWLQRKKIPKKARIKISEILNVPESELFPKKEISV